MGGLRLLRKRLSSLFLGWSWMTCGLPELLGARPYLQDLAQTKIKEQPGDPGAAKLGKLRRPTRPTLRGIAMPPGHMRRPYMGSSHLGPLDLSRSTHVDPSLVLSEGCWLVFFWGIPMCVPEISGIKMTNRWRFSLTSTPLVASCSQITGIITFSGLASN